MTVTTPATRANEKTNGTNNFVPNSASPAITSVRLLKFIHATIFGIRSSLEIMLARRWEVVRFPHRFWKLPGLPKISLNFSRASSATSLTVKFQDLFSRDVVRNPERGVREGGFAQICRKVRQTCAKLLVVHFIHHTKQKQNCREFESQFQTILCKYPFSNAPFS